MAVLVPRRLHRGDRPVHQLHRRRPARRLRPASAQDPGQRHLVAHVAHAHLARRPSDQGRRG
ncbi:hypothetical protein ACFPRL_29400 [Pseudoclavibacter helvolus]